MKWNLKDGLKDELNTRVKFKWVLRAALIASILSVLITVLIMGKNTAVELSERDKVISVLTAPEGLNLRRRYYQTIDFHTYGTYWDYCGATISAGHVHRDTGFNAPDSALGPARYIGGSIDAVFYTEGWTCDIPRNPIRGEKVWIAGYVGGADEPSIRRGTVYLKRVAGDEESAFIVQFDPWSVADFFGEPVAGGMSGGIVTDIDFNPIGILTTQNSRADTDNDGEGENGSDVSGLLDAYNILLR